MKENSWNEIGKVMMCPPIECQNRWTRLRERFSKERREIETEFKSGSGVSHRKGFTLYENMKFLNSHVQRRRTVTNFSQNKKDKENVPSTSSTSPNLMERFEKDSSQSPILQHFVSPTSPNILQQERYNLDVNMKFLNSPYVQQKRNVTNFSKNKENIPSTSSTSPNLMERFEEDSSQSPILQHFVSPTSPNILQERCYTPTQKNYTSKKRCRSESDDIEKSFLSLSNTIANKIQSLDKDVQSDGKKDEKNPEDKFVDLIAAEIKRLPEDERKIKKKEIINILWK